ncbi:hypothetical protein GWK47_040108 [Chionoecetes opilio]|uniref:Uncharacterized protein n=1 Tax=Chionoecetes opilio TaxID=41210 RepID=A0A8J4YIT9_CHIOP|nr:hypothetical protein GWK47_040108 [Chionoecetes opilio]
MASLASYTNSAPPNITSLEMMWKRAAWVEGRNEEEGVVPCTWIDEKQSLYWPQGVNAENALSSRQHPDPKLWRKFQLVKVKVSSEPGSSPSSKADSSSTAKCGSSITLYFISKPYMSTALHLVMAQRNNSASNTDHLVMASSTQRGNTNTLQQHGNTTPALTLCLPTV